MRQRVVSCAVLVLFAASCGSEGGDGFQAHAIETALLADVLELFESGPSDTTTSCVNTEDGIAFECSVKIEGRNDVRIPVTVQCDERSCVWNVTRGDFTDATGAFTPER